VKKEPKPTKVAELERRLDDLTSQLQATQSGGLSPFPAVTKRRRFNFDHIFPEDVACGPDKTPAQGDSPTEEPSSPSLSRSTVEPEWGNRSENHTSQASALPKSLDGGGCDSLWPLPNEAEVWLQDYRTSLLDLFPFVIVPPGMPATELQRQRPFLYKAVMMVSSRLDGVRQIALAEELLGEIGVATLSKPQKSFDLLQGLELLVAW
jgi:hypothetical protein